MNLETGDCVLLVLHSPREKVIGILDEITPAGIAVRGIDLGYFEDWSQAIAAGEQYLPMSDYFFPMWRVERITRDESSGNLPSMRQQFEHRTNRKLEDF